MFGVLPIHVHVLAMEGLIELEKDLRNPVIPALVNHRDRLIVQLIPVDAQLLEELIILGNNGTQMNVIHALANKVDSLRARKMQSLVFATTKAEDIIFANSSHWRTDAQDAVANQMEK